MSEPRLDAPSDERVRDLLHEPPVTCPPAAPIAEVAAALGTRRARAAVVVDPSGAPRGIVTDRDLRARVVAARRDAAVTTAADVMSAPLRTIAPDAFAFEALLEMTRHEIHHLVVVEEDGRLAGILASDALVMPPAAHPVVLAREIAAADSHAALARAAARITVLVQRLVEGGRRATDIAALVAELNDRLVLRALAAAEAAVAAVEGPAPAATPYCWLVFGSEGRREQTLRTDQDNGLVYADPTRADAAACARWFGRLAGEAIAALVAIGFPPCPAGAMASNPRWCQPLATWRGYFARWMDEPTPEHVLAACMYFDLRPVGGRPDLGRELRALLREEAPRRRHFLSALARDVVERAVPLSVLGRVTPERRGPHRGTVDLKGGGGIHLVGAGRVYALDLGLDATDTAARLAGAAAAGLLPADVASAAVEAHEHLLRLRLRHQLAQTAAGAAPDNRVAPGKLSRHEAVLLREALRTVGEAQAHLRDRYRTDLLG